MTAVVATTAADVLATVAWCVAWATVAVGAACVGVGLAGWLVWAFVANPRRFTKNDHAG